MYCLFCFAQRIVDMRLGFRVGFIIRFGGFWVFAMSWVFCRFVVFISICILVLLNVKGLVPVDLHYTWVSLKVCFVLVCFRQRCYIFYC